MCVCVFGPRSIGPLSVIYVSQVDTQLGILGKMSDDTEISDVISVLCFSYVSQVSVDLRRPGEWPAFLLLYCTSIIAADNKLFA